MNRLIHPRLLLLVAYCFAGAAIYAAGPRYNADVGSIVGGIPCDKKVHPAECPDCDSKYGDEGGGGNVSWINLGTQESRCNAAGCTSFLWDEFTQSCETE